MREFASLREKRTSSWHWATREAVVRLAIGPDFVACCWACYWARFCGLLLGPDNGPNFIACCWALIVGPKIDLMGLNLGLGFGHNLGLRPNRMIIIKKQITTQIKYDKQ